MIRLIQRRLIIPRGDTGTFTVPLLATAQTGDVQVFTIFDEKTQKKVFEKVVEVSGDAMEIEFSHADTVNLPVGDYVWDIKFYKDPDIVDGVPLNGTEIDSYYAAFKLPVCEIRQTGDTLLTADDAPTSTMAPEQLNIVLAAMNETNAAKADAANSATAAEASAQSANAAATAANTDAGRAEDAATSASTSASAASDSATAADSAKADAISAMNNAVAANTAAQTALSGAQAAATTATNKAAEATASAAAASDSATAASTSASAASSSANSAASSANSAAASVIQMDALVKTIPVNVSELNNDAGYITDDDVPVKDVQITGTSIVDENGIVEIPLATYNQGAFTSGIVCARGLGIYIADNETGEIAIKKATSRQVKLGSGDTSPIVTANQHESTFYGLAKAAGDATQSQSANAVGTYTAEAKTAIQSMLDVPSNATVTNAISTAIGNINSFDMSVVQALPTEDISTHTIYLVPKTGETNDVYDEYIYINNAWEMVGNTQVDLSNYVQKDQYATDTTPGLIRVDPGHGLVNVSTTDLNTGESITYTTIMEATTTNIKEGTDRYKIISSRRMPNAVFYGLAKAAGDSTQSTSSNAVGTYTNEAKAAIQQMLDVPSTSDIPDVSIYATKADTVLDTTLSMGRKTGTTVGQYSAAIGLGVEASGQASHAEGNSTIASNSGAHAEGVLTNATGVCTHAEGQKAIASGNASHAEGIETIASGQSSHAEGRKTTASGISAHAEGNMSIASGNNSHAEGRSIASGAYSHAEGRTEAAGVYSHTGGKYNVIDSYSSWAEWVANTEYAVGDKVKVTDVINNETTVTGYICETANSDAEFDITKWIKDTSYNYAEIIGNGTADAARSNAFALTWTGDGHYAGDVYVHSNADSTGGTKLATISDIPSVPVKDVQVNGVSVVMSGVANVPASSSAQIGVGSSNSTFITPSTQHISTFFGLAKAAKADMTGLSHTNVGTYTDAAKTAIKNMIGIEEGLKVVRLI